MAHQASTTEPAQRDYYEVLGVAREADAKAIKDAFRTLALQYHPDRNKAPDAEARFKEIAEAYAILSDPKKRADYDARGFAGVAGLNREDLFGGINFEDIFGGPNFDFGGFGPFEGFFHRRHAGPACGAPIEVVLPVSLERVASGGEEEIRLKRPASCPDCHGTGEKDGAPAPRCSACEGRGRITHTRRDAQVLIQQISECPACQGRGYTHANPCPCCQGAGQVEQEEVLSVVVPVGAQDGLVLRIAGKGLPGPEPGSPAGDLLAVVQTRPDPRFERVGADLLRHETLALTDAVLGTTLTVPTLEGSASVSVPPGTQPEAVLRLKNKGLPPWGGGPRGDLYLRMGVRLPAYLTREERALFEQLRDLQKGRVTSP